MPGRRLRGFGVAVAVAVAVAVSIAMDRQARIEPADIRSKSAQLWFTGLLVTGCAGVGCDSRGIDTHEISRLYAANHLENDGNAMIRTFVLIAAAVVIIALFLALYYNGLLGNTATP